MLKKWTVHMNCSNIKFGVFDWHLQDILGWVKYTIKLSWICTTLCQSSFGLLYTCQALLLQYLNVRQILLALTLSSVCNSLCSKYVFWYCWWSETHTWAILIWQYNIILLDALEVKWFIWFAKFSGCNFTQCAAKVSLSRAHQITLRYCRIQL